MNKIISSFIITALIIPSFAGFPVDTRAQENTPQCTPETITLVSDTTNTVNDTVNFAVPTYASHPFWTASIPGATWIWDSTEVSDPEQERVTVFVKKFTLDSGSLDSASFDIAADNGYKLEINGVTIGDKLAVERNFGSGDQTHYDLKALYPNLFNFGPNTSNTIRVTVKNLALPLGTYLNNPAGLLYKMSATRIPFVKETKVIVSDSQTQTEGRGAVPVSPLGFSWTNAILGATWVWSENPINDTPNEFAQTFTRTFTIASNTPITDAHLEISADDYYKILINGNVVVDNIDENNWTTVDQVVIPSSTLVIGQNTITFIVKNVAKTPNVIYTNPAGLLYKLTYDTNACGSAVTSDGGSGTPPVPLVAPNPPIHLSPASFSFVKPQVLTLDWTDVNATSSPVRYVFEVSSSTATTTGNAFVTIIQSSSTFSSQFDGSNLWEGVYYWHVKACDALNVCSLWTDAWKVIVDATAPTSSFIFPAPDTDFSDGAIAISGVTYDIYGVASTTLAFALFGEQSCGAFTNITSLLSATASSSFAWNYNWTPLVEGAYCLTAHGQDLAGNVEASPVVKNIKYKKTVATTTTTTTGGGGGGGNGPVVGSFGVGGSSGTGGSQGGGNTGGTSSPSSPVFVALGDTSGNGGNPRGGTVNTAVKATAGAGAVGGNTGGTGFSSGNEVGTLTGTTTDEGNEEVVNDNSNQVASVIGTSWLTWKNGLWILGILLLVTLIIWFVSRRKDKKELN